MSPYSSLSNLLHEAIAQQQSLLNNTFPKEMYEPMHYIIGLGGKRIRPLLTLIGCDLFDTDPKEAIHSAIAVELFHNFSLIHDDILDKAPLRRGHTTVHEKWNHNIALLSGDGMMVKAFEIMAPSLFSMLKRSTWLRVTSACLTDAFNCSSLFSMLK